MPVSPRLSGRIAVIAGAASAIGQAVAARLAAEGATVIGVDRLPHDTGSLALVADLTVESEVQSTFHRIHAETGCLDILYNNAGLVSPADKSALLTSSETFNQVFAANFHTARLCCQHAIPLMLQHTPTHASVINSSSFLAGMASATGQSAYNVAKAAVAQLTRDLGVHLARQGVRVNALALGPIATPQLSALFASLGPDERRRRFQHMPFGRFGTLDELAATVAFLASDDSSFLTASVFPLDGAIQNAFTVSDLPTPE